MKHLSDLHTHSTASDGQHSPTELIYLAKEKGLEVLALTDHDTINGLAEAFQTGKQEGIYVLRGTELSAEDYTNLHILGYGFSPSSIEPFMAEIKRKREERKFLTAEFLRSKGVNISLSKVEKISGNGNVGRPHFAQVLVHQGYVTNRREAFDRYLDTDEYHDFFDGKESKPSAQSCIEALKAADAKVSLAHPYQIILDRGENLEDLVHRLADYGLDAIECWYPMHTPEQRTYYLSLAKKYHLHITGGSDFHGEKMKPDHPLAALELEVDWLL